MSHILANNIRLNLRNYWYLSGLVINFSNKADQKEKVDHPPATDYRFVESVDNPSAKKLSIVRIIKT